MPKTKVCLEITCHRAQEILLLKSYILPMFCFSLRTSQYSGSNTQNSHFQLPCLRHLTGLGNHNREKTFTEIQSSLASYERKKLSLSAGLLCSRAIKFPLGIITVLALFLEEKWQKPYSKDALFVSRLSRQECQGQFTSKRRGRSTLQAFQSMSNYLIDKAKHKIKSPSSKVFQNFLVPLAFRGG